jgi:hypothetical protein
MNTLALTKYEKIVKKKFIKSNALLFIAFYYARHAVACPELVSGLMIRPHILFSIELLFGRAGIS